MTDILRNDENKVTLDDSVHTDGTRAIKKGPILGDVSNSRSLGAAVQKPLSTYVAAGSSVPKPLNLSSCLFTQNSIDQQDASNPQAVPEYASDIFHNWLKEEEKYCVAPNYMRSQTEINVKMREILVDWLTAVMEKFRLRHETLYLSVNIMDRYLEKVFIPRAKLQLVGITALFLASKYEEVAYPQLADMSHITDDTYSVDQIREMEIAIINKLGFDITVPTLNKFLLRYTKVCKDNQFVTPMANYIAHRSLQEYSLYSCLDPIDISCSSTLPP